VDGELEGVRGVFIAVDSTAHAAVVTAVEGGERALAVHVVANRAVGVRLCAGEAEWSGLSVKTGKENATVIESTHLPKSLLLDPSDSALRQHLFVRREHSRRTLLTLQLRRMWLLLLFVGQDAC
jgi:hypothetical protein